MDKEKIAQAVHMLLEGIGENPDREGLKDTPARVANMCEELFAGMNAGSEQHLSRTFEADNNELVIVNIICYRFMERFILAMFLMERS